MNEGQAPPEITPATPQLQVQGSQLPPVQSPPAAGEQVPPPQAPLTSLAPPPGGGKKPLIIIGVLAVVVGLGLWALTSLGKDNDDAADKGGADDQVEKKVVVKKSKPRKAEKTDDRPKKKEMATLSKKNRDDFEPNVGKWVLLEGEVRTGDEEGVIVFKDPVKMRGQLVRGSAENLTGQIVRVIGWMISDELIQIDGVFDVNVIDPIDLLPKKEFYTKADEAQLISLRGKKVTFEGAVKKINKAKDGKHLLIIFEGENEEIIGMGKTSTLKKDEITAEILTGLVGKTIKLKGKLAYKASEDGKKRLLIGFTEKNAYEVVE